MKKKACKTCRPRKALKDADITDGKSRDKEMEKIRDLEKLLDMGGNNPYKTVTKEIFIERLAAMDLDEKRQLAIRVGVTPTNRQTELDARLLDNFNDYVRKHQLLVGGFESKPLDMNHPAIQNIKHLLE